MKEVKLLESLDLFGRMPVMRERDRQRLIGTSLALAGVGAIALGAYTQRATIGDFVAGNLCLGGEPSGFALEQRGDNFRGVVSEGEEWKEVGRRQANLPLLGGVGEWIDEEKQELVLPVAQQGDGTVDVPRGRWIENPLAEFSRRSRYINLKGQERLTTPPKIQQASVDTIDVCVNGQGGILYRDDE